MLEKILKTYSTLMVAGLTDKKANFTQQSFMLSFRDDFELATAYIKACARETDGMNYEISSYEIAQQIRHDFRERQPHRPFHDGIIIAAIIAAGFRIERMRSADGVYTNFTFESED
jgi:hypothetical protein